MALEYLGFGDLLPNCSQFRDAVDRIHLLHGFGLDIATAECIEALAGQFGVVAQVSEELLPLLQRSNGADEVADLAIDAVASAAVAEYAAEQILLVQRREHQSRGDRRRVEQKVHLVQLESLPRLRTCAGADRDNQHAVSTR